MDFSAAKEQIYKFLGNIGVMFLATASTKGEPSLRQMSTVFFNEKIYFQTSENFEKMADLVSNPNVALGIGNYSFNGKAKILGRPVDNMDIMKVFKVKHPEAYENYSFLKDEVLIEVSLERCKIWNGKDMEHDGRETITTINFNHKSTAYIFCK